MNRGTCKECRKPFRRSHMARGNFCNAKCAALHGERVAAAPFGWLVNLTQRIEPVKIVRAPKVEAQV